MLCTNLGILKILTINKILTQLNVCVIVFSVLTTVTVLFFLQSWIIIVVYERDQRMRGHAAVEGVKAGSLMVQVDCTRKRSRQLSKQVTNLIFFFFH